MKLQDAADLTSWPVGLPEPRDTKTGGLLQPTVLSVATRLSGDFVQIQALPRVTSGCVSSLSVDGHGVDAAAPKSLPDLQFSDLLAWDSSSQQPKWLHQSRILSSCKSCQHGKPTQDFGECHMDSALVTVLVSEWKSRQNFEKQQAWITDHWVPLVR